MYSMEQKMHFLFIMPAAEALCFHRIPLSVALAVPWQRGSAAGRASPLPGQNITRMSPFDRKLIDKYDDDK